jgi:hypothetical protein
VGAELIEERPAEVVRRAARRPEGDFERIAANVVRRLSGADVYLQDDGSRHAMPDLRIVHRDGQLEYGEVITDYERAYAQMLGELLKRGLGIPLRVQVPSLRRVWYVHVNASCNIQRLQRDGPQLLAQLERDGNTYQWAGHFARDESCSSAAQLRALGVSDLSSRPCAQGEVAVMLVYPDGVTGSSQPQWDVFLAWLSHRLWSEAWRDVRFKLGACPSGRGHLFIGMTMSTPGDAYFSLSDEHSEVPPEPPDLPPEVTGVWIMPASGAGRCLVWTDEHGWRDAQRHWSCD